MLIESTRQLSIHIITQYYTVYCDFQLLKRYWSRLCRRVGCLFAIFGIISVDSVKPESVSRDVFSSVVLTVKKIR